MFYLETLGNKIGITIKLLLQSQMCNLKNIGVEKDKLQQGLLIITGEVGLTPT